MGALAERWDGKWLTWEIGLIVPRQNGKGAILEARELAGLCLFGEQLIIHTAHQFKTAREAFRRMRIIIESNPDLDRRVMKVNEAHGEEGFEFRGGARLSYIARSGSSGRGFSGDCVVYDEAMILDVDSVGGSLPTLSARQMATDAGPQVWYTASAGLGIKSTQLALIRHRGIKGDDEDLWFAEWSIDPHHEYCPRDCAEHDDRDSIDSLYKSNPGLGLIHSNGTGLTLESVDRERKGMSDEVFGCERLGIGTYPALKDGWAVIPKTWWEATTLADAPRPAGVVFGVDTTPDRGASAIAVCGSVVDGGDFNGGYVEITDHRPGTNWLLARAKRLDRQYGPTVWVIDPRAAAGSLIDEFESSDLKVEQPSATDMAHAFGAFYDAVRDDQLRHASDREVANALAGAAVRRLGDGQAWDRQHVAVDISPLVAYTLAWWGWQQHGGNDYNAVESVHFDLPEILRLCRLGVYAPHDLKRLYEAGLIDDAGLKFLADNGVRV